MKNFFLSTLFLLFSIFGLAANIVVNNNADDLSGGTLREAIAAASDGDEITFNLGSGDETITLILGELFISKTLTIDGSNTSGSGVTVTLQVDEPGISPFRVFSIDANGKTITLSNMTVMGGNVSASSSNGGSIYILAGTLNLDHIHLQNSKAHYGGGLCCCGAGIVTMTNCSVSGCTSTNSGAGIACLTNNLNMTNCTVNNNATGDFLQGGGMYISNNTETVNLKNCTFYGNSAEAGGGIFLGAGGLVSVDFCTFCDNTTNYGGGIYNASGLQVKNSILANNTGSVQGPDFYHQGSGVVFDLGYNIVESSYGFTWSATGDITGDQSNLFGSGKATQTLGNNGGPTQTLAIESGSVAIGSGSYDATITTDQRGISRNNPPTIGAVEFGGNFTWDGSEDSDWNTADNWDLSIVPSISDNVTIANTGTAPVIALDINASCNNLTVNSGASLTVESGGSLLTNGSVNGSVDVELWIQPGEWHLISIPNNNTTANTFLGDYLQTWSEPNETWSDIIDPSTNLLPAKGYSCWSTDGVNNTVFSGTPNNGNQEIGMTNNFSGYYQGYNLVGNPYPSSIDWTTLQESYGAAYLWNPVGGDYDEITSGHIAPMQGFFIYADYSPKLFQMNNSNRSHGGSFLKGTDFIENSLVLYATYKEFTDKFTLIFDDMAQEGFTLTDDAWKLMSGHNGVSQLWSYCSDGKLAIDKRPPTESIQLGFANNEPGAYTIGISEIADISHAVLEDTKTNIFHDLTTGPYTFAWDLTDVENRFLLHLGPTAIPESEAAPTILIYAHNQTIHLHAENPKPIMLHIRNMLGQTLVTQSLPPQKNHEIPVQLTEGIYIVTASDGDQTISQKVWIR